jgi:phosphate transport system substrate-binding protein
VYLSGAGSTFDNPFFSKAFDAYSRVRPGVSIDYASVGSGAGIQQFTKRTVDFGATDIPMNATELAAYPSGASAVVQLPVTLGGVVVAYNVPELSDESSSPHAHLRLSPDVVAGIFIGAIKSWNDPAVGALNPGVKLPSLPITVVHRADASGTTYMFTDYLSTASPAWRTKVGKGKTVEWYAQASLGAKGNEGVAGQIKNSPGSIGYVELAYALATHMDYASIRNRDGTFVVPTMASVQAAASKRPAISPLHFSIVDMPGAASYPIAGYSWLLLDRKDSDAAKGAALCALARWLLSDGQKIAPSVDYVALPADVSRTALADLGPCTSGS